MLCMHHFEDILYKGGRIPYADSLKESISLGVARADSLCQKGPLEQPDT